MAKVSKELQVRDTEIVDSDLQYNVYVNKRRPVKKQISNRGVMKSNRKKPKS
jgi:hypothetical protein